MAFHKILKKYKVHQSFRCTTTLTNSFQKWTGSASLSDRFSQQVLGNSKSFIRRDFTPLLQLYRNLLNDLREHTPDTSGPSTPRISRQPSKIQVQHGPQSYWNEYDNGSEAGDEPYTIYVDPNAESTFPGAKTVSNILSGVKVPMDKVRTWLNPHLSSDEQRPLLDSDQRISTPNRNIYFLTHSETDIDDDASSSDFPSGYTAHYSTFPSVSDQKFAQYRETLIFRGTIASFAGSLLLLLIATLLIVTGKHKLRVEVDVGAIIGVVSSLFFATMGLGMMLYQTDRVGLLQRITVCGTFIVICILNGFLLVLIGGNTSL